MYLEFSMVVNWEERTLIAKNIEFLWKIMQTEQDKILKYHNQRLDEQLLIKEESFTKQKSIYIQIISKLKNDIAEQSK
jgi:hypothetical protein